MIRRVVLPIAVLLSVGLQAATAQQCKPTPGLFITTMIFLANPSYTATPYTVTRTTTTIQVSQAASVIYTHAIPNGFISTYAFYGTGNRYFLTRDVRTTNTDVWYKLGLVNLGAPGSPAEYSLLNQSYPSSGTPDLNVQPSQGNGQAVFVFVGSGGQVSNLTIYCSENGVGICSALPFAPAGQVIAEATTATVRIKEGGTIRAECNLPVPASPSITVTPSATTTTVGSTLDATATLSGGNSPTGTIIFKLYSPSASTCSGTPTFTPNTLTVSGNGSYSTPSGFTANAAGVWHWTATYSGDANNNQAISACAAAAVTVTRKSPSITTTANPTSAAIGATLNAQAALSNGYMPTGTITFKLYSPSAPACSGTPAFTSNTVTVSGNGTYSTPSGFTVNALGTWHWIASYSGDGNNNAVSTACAASVAVNKASPSISTTANPTSGTLGAMLNDQATLSGGYNATGTISFKLYPPSDANCSGAPAFQNNVTVNGNNTYSMPSGFPANAWGTWHWIGSYSGDGNNNSASSACGAEPVALKVTPSINTNANPVTCTVCTIVNDEATLSGGNSPTGTITFKLYPPSDATCSGAGSFTSSVPVNGNAMYNTPSGFAVTRAGTWHWTASYSGDATNNAANSVCTAEPITVTGDYWTTKAPIPNRRRALGVGVVNGILYTIGGFSTTNTVVATVEAYDPATNSWSTRAPMPTARAGAAIGVVNGILYAIGGVTSGGASTLATVEAYDPATNSWSTRTPMPTARAGHAIGVLNSIVYAIGGATGGAFSQVAKVEAYDPVTNTWTTKAPMPTARSQFAVGVSNGVLFAIGGSTSNTTFATVEAYNPALNTWTTKAPMPAPRYQTAAGVVNGIVYVVGGLTATNATVATNQAYDPVTDSWTTVAPMPTARANLSVGVINCLLFAVDGGFTTVNEAYQP